jgi:NAD(P)-dependent dehydrogenase (short-subunit alcohol dehydrogenase family)
MRLKGKRVLITGTAGGQGAAAQAMFAKEGARIIGCDRCLVTLMLAPAVTVVGSEARVAKTPPP